VHAVHKRVTKISAARNSPFREKHVHTEIQPEVEGSAPQSFEFA
jgi:hypothetical protein